MVDAHVQRWRQVLPQLIWSHLPLLVTTQLRKSEKEEMVVVGADVGVGSGADDLALEKECLLAELDVERDEMRRRLLAFEMTRGGREYVDGNEVEEEWKEKVCEKSSEEEKCLDKDVVPTGNGKAEKCFGDTRKGWESNEWIKALEVKNRLLEFEIKSLRESLASIEERKKLFSDGEVEENGVVASFKELWLDRERLQAVCSALEGRLTACLAPSFFFPSDKTLPGSSTSTPLTLPLPDLLLGHSFNLHSSLARCQEEIASSSSSLYRCREETAAAMAEMRRGRSQYLGIPRETRPPLSLAQAIVENLYIASR